MATHSEKTIESADGTSLFLQTWFPEENETPRAQVLICHGYLEHGGRYREIGEYFASQQIAATALDFRGHGRSSGTRAFVSKFPDYHEDVKAALCECGKQTSDECPLFVLAHSNGALAVMDYLLTTTSNNDASTPSIRGVVLTSPFLAPAGEVSYVKVLLSKILGSILPKLSLPADEVTADVVMHDKEKIKEHDADPLILSNFTLGWALHAMNAQARIKEKLDKEKKEFPLPVLFAYAEDDKVACAKTNRESAEKMVQEDKTILERKGEYHEILNETNRRELFGILRDWMLKRV